MKKSEKARLTRLLKKCVLECIEISYLSKVVVLLDVDFTSPPENAPLGIGTTYKQPEFADVVDRLKQTKSYEKLAIMIKQFIPSLFKTRVDDIIYTTLHRAILPKIIPGVYRPQYGTPYFWNEDNFKRAFQELMDQFQQPDNRCRYIAPIFNFSIKETIQIDEKTTIRKATPFDRHQISDYEYSSVFLSDDYDCVLEIKCTYDLNLGFDKKETYGKFIELSKSAINFVSCLRIFSGSLAHLRFGVFVVQDEGLIIQSPGLIESPELALRSELDQFILPNRDAKELSLFWENYSKLLGQDYFQRAINRYNKGVVDWEETGKFIDFVLALESLFDGSLAEKQYKAATLVCHRNKDRLLVYDFLDIVIKQRGGVIHGQKEFGDKFLTKIRNFYGQKRDLRWFLSDLEALVRQCLRLSVIAYNLQGKKWDTSIVGALFKHLTNKPLVGITKGWALRGLPSFL